jgi:uncharacterized damage-inducible protein DinB
MTRRAKPESGELSYEPIDVLLKHDEWATRRILEISLALSDDEFDQAFGIGPGSLRATLLHILTRYSFWADTIAERGASEKPARPRLGLRSSARAMLDALAPAAADFRSVANEAMRSGAHAIVKPAWSRVPVITKGAAIVHMCTHAMHHRAQCLIMLRRLGRADIIEAADNIGTAEWQSEVETKRLKPPRLPVPRDSKTLRPATPSRSGPKPASVERPRKRPRRTTN